MSVAREESVTRDEADGPGWFDVMALATEVLDELVVGSARDTHRAIADRVHGLLRRPTGGASVPVEFLHGAIAGSVYGGIGVGLRAASRGFGAAGRAGLGPRFETGPRERFARSAVNGLIGDRLVTDHPSVAIPMAVRLDGQDVPPTRAGLAEAFPDAREQVVVFLHGLSESESYFNRGRDRVGGTYPETVAEQGWTPVMLRANTGLSLRENGVALSSLLDRLVESWPVPLRRVALVGHSMGGLVMRAACAVRRELGADWGPLVTDVVTLGTPHLGAPLARRIGDGSRVLAMVPETAAFGRILDWRSVGVHDLVEGLAEDVPPLPHARYRLVSATLTRSPRHPVGRVLGDLLVRESSAYGRDDARADRCRRDLFPGADVLHLPSSDHFDLLNHPRVHEALRDWLA